MIELPRDDDFSYDEEEHDCAELRVVGHRGAGRTDRRAYYRVVRSRKSIVNPFAVLNSASFTYAVQRATRHAALVARLLAEAGRDAHPEPSAMTTDHMLIDDLSPTVPLLRAHAVLTAAPAAHSRSDHRGSRQNLTRQLPQSFSILRESRPMARRTPAPTEPRWAPLLEAAEYPICVSRPYARASDCTTSQRSRAATERDSHRIVSVGTRG